MPSSGALADLHSMLALLLNVKCKPMQGPEPFRHPDTLSTIPSSMCMDSAPEHDDPAFSCLRLLSEGYFCMPPDQEDWPSLEQVEDLQAVRGFLTWLSSILVLEDGFVNVEKVLSIHSKDIPATEVKQLAHSLACVNLAWLQVHQYTELEQRCVQTQQAIMRQAEEMTQKLSGLMQRSMLSEDALHRKMQATENWRTAKLQDVADQLAGKSASVRDAIQASFLPTLSIWKHIHASAQQHLHMAAAPFLQNPGHARGAGDDDDDDLALLQELNEGVQRLSLEE